MRNKEKMLDNSMNQVSARDAGRRRPAAIFGLLLVLVTAVHLFAQLTQPTGMLADVTQVMLMPLLAAVVFTLTVAPRSKMIRLILIALGFSWVGDTLPRFMSGDPAFLAMVAGFLVAQFFYIAALLPLWKQSVLRRPWLALPYLAAFVLLLVLCAPGAGSLLVPVVIYGVALMSMAILSTGLGVVGGIGGAIFFISDGLIALRSFSGLDVPGMGFWIMLTYVLGQAMLSFAVTKRN